MSHDYFIAASILPPEEFQRRMLLIRRKQREEAMQTPSDISIQARNWEDNSNKLDEERPTRCRHIWT